MRVVLRVVYASVLSWGSFAAAPAVAAPAEKEVAAAEIPGKQPLALSVIRQRLSDGGLKLRLLITPKGEKKAKTVVLYEGGADDDGPTDKSFRGLTIEPYGLPGGKRGARVDFEYQVPGTKKRQTDTYLASLDDTPRLVLETTTRRERDRTRVCHEVEENTLTLEKDGRLFLKSMSLLESELNDDDLPIDKTCRGRQANPQVTYKFDGETFLQIDPPPATAKKKSAEESDD